MLSTDDRCVDGGGLQTIAFAARCIPGVIGAWSSIAGPVAVRVDVCVLDGVDYAEVSRAIWEASPATISIEVVESRAEGRRIYIEECA